MSIDKGMSTAPLAKLRERAQDYLAAPIGKVQSMSQEDVKKLVHELDTYQIELELQNEDLRNTQKDLEESRSRISDLYDFAPVGHLTINETGLILEANLTVASMLGVTRGILLKQPLSKFIVDEDQDIHFRCRKKLLDSKKPQSYEVRMKNEGGTIFNAQIDSAARDDVDGESGQFRAVITDITKQKTAAIALVRAKKEWEQTFDAISDIITLQDLDMHILRTNKAACDFFGLEYEEIIGKKCYDLFRGTQEPCPGCPALETLAANASHTEIITHDRLQKTFLVTSSTLPDESGIPTQIIHVAKDITEQQKNEVKIRQAHRLQAVGTLAGGIAHEFNNMLGVIMGCADMARDEMPKDSFARAQLDKVMKASNRTKDLVKQILVSSRQSQKIYRNLQLKPLIKETIKLIEDSLASSIEIHLDIPDINYTIMIDPSEMQQILMNLFANAAWAMKEKGLVSITLDLVSLPEDDPSMKSILPLGKYVKLNFSDTGVGMDKSTMARVFDPFYTTKNIGQGTGLGLSIVMGMMEGYGGKITLDSVVGKGTTFHLYFPASKEKSAEVNEQSERIPEGSERILFVDDEEMYAEMGDAMISHLGYMVTMKTDSREALEVFKSNPTNYDLIITDQIMPEYSGEELVKEIRSIRPNMPIILCTGYSTQMDEKKAKSLGINEFAYKPIVKKDIAKLIRKVLDD